MELTPMQYKGFVWPHNPRTYTIRFERRVAAHKIPFGRCALQDLGLHRRVMEGEGVFCGPGAYETFRRLAAVFYQDGPGQLIHPVWQSARVYFVALSLSQEPRRDYVRYRFAFWEDSGTEPVRRAAEEESPPTGDEVYHTVVPGETLWGIAQAWNLSLGGLLERNPQIKNPNVIQAGQQIRVR